MSSLGQDSLTTKSTGIHQSRRNYYSNVNNDASPTPTASSSYHTYHPHLQTSQPLMYLPVTIEDGVLRPFTGNISGTQVPVYNGVPLVWGFSYDSNDNWDNNLNSNERRNNHSFSPESFMPFTTATNFAYHHLPPSTGQVPLGWLSQHPFLRGSSSQATPSYGRQLGRRMKPRNRAQANNVGSKDWEASIGQLDSCDSAVKVLRRVVFTNERRTLSFVGSEIDKRRIHRILVEEHTLKNVLGEHFRLCEGSRHVCDEIFRAVFASFFSTVEVNSLVEKCMLCLNKVSASSSCSSIVPLLFVERLDTYIRCLYDHVERVRRILSESFVKQREESFVVEGNIPWGRQLSNFQYYQGKALSFLYCRHELNYLQKKLVELDDSIRHFENEALAQNGRGSLIETERFKVFLESFHCRLKQEVSVNWLSDCESKLNEHLMKLFESAHAIFNGLQASVISYLEYLTECKDNVERQASKLESLSKLNKRYAAAKELTKEVSRLIETKDQRCQKVTEERLRLIDLNVSLAKLLRRCGRECLTREIMREASLLLRVQRSIDSRLEQLFSISFGEVLDLLQTSLKDSEKKSNRKFARFSLNLPASVVVVEPSNTPRSGIGVDIASPRQRHHRMKSNPDALLHVDRLSPCPAWNQMENGDVSPCINSISFSQVSDDSIKDNGELDLRPKGSQSNICCDEQVDDGHNPDISRPRKENSKSLEYAIRTLSLRKLEDHETAWSSGASCYYDATVRKCHSTVSTPRREDSKDWSCLKKTKTTTVVSPKTRLQPAAPFHHRSQRSQSFDDIIVL